MMKINIFISFVALSIFSKSFSQIDSNSGGNISGNNTFGSITIDANKTQKPKSLEFKNEDGFKTAADDLKEKQKQQQKEEDLKNKGILTKAKIAEERYNKSFKPINGVYPIIDQDLGTLNIKSESIIIRCRDFQYPDGDRVTIYVNDVPVVVNHTLQQNFRSFQLPLDPGINQVKIVALNQGPSGPNTAAFKIFNKEGNLISSKEWNLATGAKATMIVAREE